MLYYFHNVVNMNGQDAFANAYCNRECFNNNLSLLYVSYFSKQLFVD